MEYELFVFFQAPYQIIFTNILLGSSDLTAFLFLFN